MGSIVEFIVETIGQLGYVGIFFMMFLESSFFPFPSEVVMIPAGYLAYKGEMNMLLAIAMGIAGSIAGAMFNYVLALKFGRGFVLAFGKYFFFTEENMQKMEAFFAKHGEISTLMGRLIPVVRQYISIPAGLGRMNIAKFCIYTMIGAGVWISILAILGYYVGGIFSGGMEASDIVRTFTSSNLTSEELKIKSYVTKAVIWSLVSVVLIIGIYIITQRKMKK